MLIILKSFYNTWQKIWNKIDKSSKAGQVKEGLIFTVLNSGFNFWKGDWAPIYLKDI